jgi:hypothetical protein
MKRPAPMNTTETFNRSSDHCMPEQGRRIAKDNWIMGARLAMQKEALFRWLMAPATPAVEPVFADLALDSVRPSIARMAGGSSILRPLTQPR